jgi:hypothetical protein
VCYSTPVRVRTSSILLPISLALAACHASTMQQGPSDTLRAYSRALEEGRADDAYKLLSDEARRSISLEAFRRMVKENPDEVRDIARALARPSSDPVVTATVSSPNGETLLLVYEGGKWQIDGSAIDLYAQTTPRQAIEAFLRAFDQKRWDVLVRFVPEAHLDGIDAAKLQAAWQTKEQAEEMQRITSAIRAALPTAAIEETGDRATMAYGAGGTVQLVREHGSWKIEDFD